jgi:hypothetical protein
MSGYGYYDEEGEGLLTGAGARAKKRFVATRAVSERTGRSYPKRVGYTLEYASKILYNKRLAENNKWLEFANNNAEVQAARAQMAEAMRKAAAAWREKMKKAYEAGQISEDNYKKMQARWERADKIGNTKKYRAHIAQSRINNFVAKYPIPKDAVAFFNNPMNRRITPIGRNAKIIFLRVAYKIPKEEAEKYFPKYMKTPKPVRFTYPIEEAEMFNIPEYNPKEQPVVPPKTTTETETLTEVTTPTTTVPPTTAPKKQPKKNKDNI